MLNVDVKRKINTLRDILVGKVPDPKAQVEQITIAMIYKFMDDMDLEGMEFGGNRVFFQGEYEKYAWTNVMQSENSGQQRSNLYAEGIDRMSVNPYLPQLFRDIFRGAYVPYRDPETLNMFLKEINDIRYDNSEDLGNAFEYLLSIMGSQGDAGQFRTPRHIIDMIVEIIDPKKTDSILDPACGTAGFLISAYKHILENNKDKDGRSTLSADERNRMTENFAGYDISPDMVRLSRVNMYLHNFTKPQISEYDTLSSLDKWGETYDVIVANPPFMTPKGGIIPHNRYRVRARRAEVLFVDYIAEHLNPTGKAGVIVPEGIAFQTANAYKELRKYLVEDDLLYAVISLPAGVFNPYSGVKTSILLIDRTLAKQRDEILFLKINNDGYSLGTQRHEIKDSDIPEAIKIIKDYRNGMDISQKALVTLTSKKDIAVQDYILIGDRYKETLIINSDYPVVSLGEVCLITSGQSPESQYYNMNGEGMPFYQGKTEFTDKYLGKPQKWTSKITKIAVKNDIVMSVRAPVGPVNIVTEEICIGRGLASIRCSKELMPGYLFYILRNMEDKIKGNSGSTFASINRSGIEDIKIPIPPLHIQEQIMKDIEEYQKIIDGAKQVVENYKPTFKIDPSWKMMKFKDVTYDIRNGVNVEQINDKGKYRVTRIQTISDGTVNLEKTKWTNDEPSDNYFMAEGDVLLSHINSFEHLAKTAFFTNIHENVVHGVNLIRYRFNDQIVNPNYAILFMKSDEFINKARTFAQRAVNQASIKTSDLKNIEIPCPEYSIQNEIVKKVNEEMGIVEQNKRLIEIFKKKVHDKITEVYGASKFC